MTARGATLPRGRCSGCGELRAVTGAGIRGHHRGKRQAREYCPGSNRPPAPEPPQSAADLDAGLLTAKAATLVGVWADSPTAKNAEAAIGALSASQAALVALVGELRAKAREAKP